MLDRRTKASLYKRNASRREFALTGRVYNEFNYKP